MRPKKTAALIAAAIFSLYLLRTSQMRRRFIEEAAALVSTGFFCKQYGHLTHAANAFKKGSKMMTSRIKLLGHPLHQMLIVFPLGLLATAAIFDLVTFITQQSQFTLVAYWLIASGIIGGLLAAPPGWVDWFAIPKNTRAKKIGLIHGLGNVVVLVLFIGSWMLRRNDPTHPEILAYALSFAAVMLAMFTGWLGGELVDRLGVGVDEDANLNASNSLLHHH